MLAPINLQQWIAEHADALRPPVCNEHLYEAGDFIIIVVGGPNARKDYHHNAGAEFFYQLRGDMVLRVREDGKPRDITIREGETFLLPPHVHHSPQRVADSIGLVIERRRTEDELDGFVWYCEECHEKLYDVYVPLKNIVEDLPVAFRGFWDNPQHQCCQTCGTVMQEEPRELPV